MGSSFSGFVHLFWDPIAFAPGDDPARSDHTALAKVVGHTSRVVNRKLHQLSINNTTSVSPDHPGTSAAARGIQGGGKSVFKK